MYTDNSLKNLGSYKMTIVMQSAACERMAKQAAVKPSITGALISKVTSAVKAVLAGKPTVSSVKMDRSLQQHEV